MITAGTVIGIDPSLTATGIVALERDETPLRAWRVVFRRTVRPSAKLPLLERLDRLSRDVHQGVREAIIGRQEPMTAAAEFPSDFRVPGKGGPSQRFLFGCGVGVALLAVARACGELHVPLTTYGVNEWLPRQSGRRGGGWRHPMKHEQVIAQARLLIPGTKLATDDETMAAALALSHVLRGPQGGMPGV